MLAKPVEVRQAPNPYDTVAPAFLCRSRVVAGVDDLLQLLPSMALPDLQRLGKAVEQAVRTKRAAALAEPADRPRCPHCRGGAPWRWGKTGEVPRWRCRDCKKTFTALTGTPLAFAKRRPELLAVALDMLGHTPRSCRKLAEALEVHWITIWRWRLKLRSIDGWADGGLTGLVEADETFFRESRKGSREWSLHAKGAGPQPPRPRWREFDRKKALLPRGLSRWQIPVLVLRDRHGGTCTRRLESLKLAAFEPVLDAGLAADALLCTDGGAVYRRWGKARGRAVEQINTRRGIRVRNGVIHIQNANAYHSRFKDFMKPFRGPATRHLRLYIAWMAFRDQLRGASVVGNPLIDRLVRDVRRSDPTRRKASP